MCLVAVFKFAGVGKTETDKMFDALRLKYENIMEEEKKYNSVLDVMGLG